MITAEFTFKLNIGTQQFCNKFKSAPTNIIVDMTTFNNLGFYDIFENNYFNNIRIDARLQATKYSLLVLYGNDGSYLVFTDEP